MTVQSRPTFLQTIGTLLSLPAALTAATPRRPGDAHTFIARDRPDTSDTPVFHGYPDECYAYAAFADSLVALSWGEGWRQQPPIVSLRTAIVVDFASETEQDAQASIGESWNGVWELPMGATSTLQACVELDAQNERSTRHLALIATSISHGDFERRVTRELVDSRTCNKKGCDVCANRADRDLADVLRILANGTGQSAVQLFSNWQPSDALQTKLDDANIAIVHHALRSIPAADLEANRSYHVWGGTPLQGQEFRRAIWTPQWKVTG